MELPTPPTDNLYKFQALSGLTIIVLTVWFLAGQLNDVLLQCIDARNDITRLELEMSNVKQDIKLLVDNMSRMDESLTNVVTQNQKDNAVAKLNKYGEQRQELQTQERDILLKGNAIEAKAYLIDWEKSKVEILGILGVFAIAFGLILSIHGFRNWYKKIQVYQDQILKNESELALKEFEAKISERHVKLTGIHPKQMEIVADTYGKLLALYNALEAFSAGLFGDDPDTKSKVVDAAYKEFSIFYYPKAIYLPKTAVSKVAALSLAADNLARTLNQIHTLDKMERTVPLQETINKLYEKKPTLERAFGDCYIAVVNEFQFVLGVATESDQEPTKK